MKVFPVILAILDVGAAIVSLCQKDYARAIYWLSAAILTTTTLYMR
jgi:hypothetical protein